jgi:tetrapyrrole methylase family protein/MazG family protein
MNGIKKLWDLVSVLRAENGCPWDREQTIEDLREFFLEEAHEVADAIDNNDTKELCEELGDLLFQIVFATSISEEKGLFGFEDVCNGIYNKMISRHPHVFGDAVADTSDEVLKKWNELKLKEKKHRTSILDGITISLPALKRAEKIQKKASKVGFDWEKAEEVALKVHEEWDELQEAINLKDQEKINEEFGDILFSLVNFSRFIGVDSERSLRKTVDKFESRFRYVEKRVLESKKAWDEFDLESLDEFWDEAKKLANRKNPE